MDLLRFEGSGVTDYNTSDWPAQPPLSALVNRVHHTDALDLLAALPSGSVDAFITDLPYGTTACSWDEIIPFDPMWKEVKRTLKPRGVFVTTASQPFTSKLVMSNVGMFRYEWIWEKAISSGFLSAKYRPLRQHENILVFSEGASIGGANSGQPMTYNPQFEKGEAYTTNPKSAPTGIYNKHHRVPTVNEGIRYPKTIIKFTNERGEHPTQKPVDLFKYLISTYTQPGDLVVDFCCGSGTTAIAARNLGRRFIVGDITSEYVQVARDSLAQPYTPNMFAKLEAVS